MPRLVGARLSGGRRKRAVGEVVEDAVGGGRVEAAVRVREVLETGTGSGVVGQRVEQGERAPEHLDAGAGAVGFAHGDASELSLILAW
jgi:hypothetical protein